METPSTTRIGSADKRSSASSQAASTLPCGPLSTLEMSISLLYVFAPSYPFLFSSLKHLVVPILDEQSGSPNPIITFSYTSLSSPTPTPFLRSPSLSLPVPPLLPLSSLPLLPDVHRSILRRQHQSRSTIHVARKGPPKRSISIRSTMGHRFWSSPDVHWPVKYLF